MIIILAASQAYILSGTDLIYQSSVWNDKVIHEGILRTQRASCEKAKYICFHTYWCLLQNLVSPVTTYGHTPSTTIYMFVFDFEPGGQQQSGS